MVISDIDLLVHPDYYQIERPFPELHPIQENLRAAWQSRVQSISTNKHHALFYFSPFSKQYIDNPTLHNLQILLGRKKIPLLEHDIGRIKRFGSMLKDRFVLFGSNDFPIKNGLLRIFNERNFTYEPDRTNIWSYGELTDTSDGLNACVPAWGERIQSELNIPYQNLYFPHELALNMEQVAEIREWRTTLTEGSLPPNARA